MEVSVSEVLGLNRSTSPKRFLGNFLMKSTSQRSSSVIVVELPFGLEFLPEPDQGNLFAGKSMLVIYNSSPGTGLLRCLHSPVPIFGDNSQCIRLLHLRPPRIAHSHSPQHGYRAGQLRVPRPMLSLPIPLLSPLVSITRRSGVRSLRLSVISQNLGVFGAPFEVESQLSCLTFGTLDFATFRLHGWLPGHFSSGHKTGPLP